MGWLLAAAAMTTPLHAQQLERTVKAAFLPKFARYVSWPPETSPAEDAPIQLCIVGTDPFGILVNKAAASERAGSRAVVLRRIASAEQANGCHIAFVQGSSPEATANMLAAIGDRAILTVTDDRGGSTRGMIHFSLHQGRVRFHIDDAAAARRKLSIDSRLLGLALTVKQRKT